MSKPRRKSRARRALIVLALLALLGGVLAAGAVQYVLQVPFKRALVELPTKRRINPPHPGETIAALRDDSIPLSFGAVGPSPERTPVCYDSDGRPLAREDSGAAGATCSGGGRLVRVGPGSLESALAQANPGDEIVLGAGDYRLASGTGKLQLGGAGTRTSPIIVRAERLGEARMSFDMTEGFLVTSPYWVFENLDITGVCAEDTNCEHAFHLSENAANTVIRNNRIRNFNSAIKINRYLDEMPDDVLVERNLIFNERSRETTRPVTPVDAVAVDRLHVVANVIADFGSNGGSRISYAAFAKGGGAGALFERNLILCEWRNKGGFRVGLSLGGGGTDTGLCRQRRCKFEQKGGTIRNNVIANCSSAGVFLRDAPDSRVENNLVRDTPGVEAFGATTRARLANNIIDGHVLWRNGAAIERDGNISSLWRAAMLSRVSDGVLARPVRGDIGFRSKDDEARRGVAVEGAPRDFCGRRYSPQSPPIGPVDWTVPGCAPVVPGLR